MWYVLWCAKLRLVVWHQQLAPIRFGVITCPHAAPAMQNLANVNTLELFLRTDSFTPDAVKPGVSIAVGAWASSPTLVRVVRGQLSPGPIVQAQWTRVRIPLSSLGLAASGTVSVRATLCRLGPIPAVCMNLVVDAPGSCCRQITEVHVVSDVDWSTLYIDNVSFLKV